MVSILGEIMPCYQVRYRINENLKYGCRLNRTEEPVVWITLRQKSTDENWIERYSSFRKNLKPEHTYHKRPAGVYREVGNERQKTVRDTNGA